MFCLRSWLPLLFIPTNASPAFIFIFFVCTYFLNRPCVYCSILLLILFTTSCNWSDRCFFDFSSDWFQPRTSTPTTAGTSGLPTAATGHYHDDAQANTELVGSVVVDMVNTTARALLGLAADHVASRNEEWTGLGMEWLRSLLGRREWRIECLDVYIRL